MSNDRIRISERCQCGAAFEMDGVEESSVLSRWLHWQEEHALSCLKMGGSVRPRLLRRSEHCAQADSESG